MVGLRERLGAAASGVRSWRHADNATRDAFLRGLSPPAWTSPPLNPHPDPLANACAELLLDQNACVHAAHGRLDRKYQITVPGDLDAGG